MSAATDARVEEALRWLGMACGDLATAASAQTQREVPARNVAFHAQQAVEKSLKAALILAGKSAPRTHDLDSLRDRLPAGWQVKQSHRDLTRLSQYAVESRYPDDVPMITKLQSSASLRQARAMYRSICAEFEARGISLDDLGCI